ncbi:MAG: serine hydrolase [Actinobacteria bacterium]|nr:serine hydrolase [Actinomycetota bacterium]
MSALLIIVALLTLTVLVAHNLYRSSSARAAARSTGETTNDVDPTTASDASDASDAPADRATAAPISPEASASALRLLTPKATVDAEIASLTSSLGPSGVSVAALNTVTGASYSYGATGGMNTGSVVKLDILETLLLEHQQAGQPLTDDEDANAMSMIENSDNDAAEALWEDVGSDQAVSRANQTLGPLPNTVPGADDYWGLTITDASDQLLLLRNLVSTDGPLDAASQAYALNLMRNVESDQRWGVGAVADAGTTFANKNGWLAVSDDDNLWLVNSLGIVTVQGQQVLLAIMTQHDSSESAGIATVESIAAAVAPAVAI